MKAVISTHIYNYFLVHFSDRYWTASKLYSIDKLSRFLSYCEGRGIDIEIQDDFISNLIIEEKLKET